MGCKGGKRGRGKEGEEGGRVAEPMGDTHPFGCQASTIERPMAAAAIRGLT